MYSPPYLPPEGKWRSEVGEPRCGDPPARHRRSATALSAEMSCCRPRRDPPVDAGPAVLKMPPVRKTNPLYRSDETSDDVAATINPGFDDDQGARSGDGAGGDGGGDHSTGVVYIVTTFC